jgi:Flp pilus assembly protein TadD
MRAPPIIAALLALTATAAHAAKPVRAADPALHAYMFSRYAVIDKEVGLAARLMEEVRQADPAAGGVTRRAWELALAAGDAKRAFQLARQMGAAGDADPAILITRLADAVLRKDMAGAAQLRKGLGGQGWPMVAGPIIDAWAMFARGDTQGALAALDPQRTQGFMRAYVAEQRAHMLAGLGRWDEAAAAYRQARAGGGPAVAVLRQGQADALAMAGRRDEALAVLFPSDRQTAVARQKLEAGRRLGPVAPDARTGLAWMFIRLSADVARERAEPLALLFARLASFMAPEQPLVWVTVGDLLGRSGQNQAALAALAKVPGGFGLDEVVRGRQADLLDSSGQGEAAGALLQAAARAPGASPEDLGGLAAWHQRAGRFADAATAYGLAIDRFGAGMGSSAWNLHFLRGMMRDRAGDWPGAEADLKAALALVPEEPGVLNYLGYSLMERGEQTEAARAMIERAAALRPGDGGIIDSLGWMQLKLGQVDQAVATLERALTLEPEDPTITSHLGDALWHQGRRIEARFRWRRALAVAGEGDERRRLQARLDYGLDAAPAMLALK